MHGSCVEYCEPRLLNRDTLYDNWVTDLSPYLLVFIGNNSDYIVQHLSRWLIWKGLKVENFNSQTRDHELDEWMKTGQIGMLIMEYHLPNHQMIERLCSLPLNGRLLFVGNNVDNNNLSIIIPESVKCLVSTEQNRQVEMRNFSLQIDIKLAYFMMNLRKRQNNIYLSRHGESMAQVEKIIGTDPNLTERGQIYVSDLKRFMDNMKSDQKIKVLCSTLKRSYITAEPFVHDENYVVQQWRQLEEIDGGHFDGCSYHEISNEWPKTYHLRQNDKYRCAWPGGESYQQMILRLENIFLEIERSDSDILIIGHQAILRAILAYLTNQKPENCTETAIPSHHVFKINYDNSGHVQLDIFNLDKKNDQ